MRNTAYTLPPCPIEVMVDKQKNTCRLLTHSANFHFNASVTLPIEKLRDLFQAITTRKYAEIHCEGVRLVTNHMSTDNLVLAMETPTSDVVVAHRVEVFFNNKEKGAFIALIGQIITSHRENRE